MKELYDLLVINKVSPNGLFVLHCTFHNYMYPNYVNFHHEQYRLEVTGHLKKEESKLGPVYQLTDKGLSLIREVEHLTGKQEKAKKQKLSMDGWDEYIKQYNELFPKGRKEGSTMSFRCSPKELKERFIWFFKEYPEYTWEQVLDATRKYVNSFEQESEGFRYMQTSKYFLKKDDKNRTTTSNLATLCYNIAEGNDVEIDSGFHYFGP